MGKVRFDSIKIGSLFRAYGTVYRKTGERWCEKIKDHVRIPFNEGAMVTPMEESHTEPVTYCKDCIHRWNPSVGIDRPCDARDYGDEFFCKFGEPRSLR